MKTDYIFLFIFLLLILSLYYRKLIFKKNTPTITSIAATVDAQSESRENLYPQNYLVKTGDTLEKISLELYGFSEIWPEIATMNNLINPNYLIVGQTLDMPSEILINKTYRYYHPGQIASGVSIEAITGNSYVVKKNDSLWKIAEQAYGDSRNWSKLAQANNLITPDIITEGFTLTIPR